MRKPFTYLLGAAALALAATACSTPAKNDTTEITEVKMTKERLLDKIKGGWAGQAIGCTYGGPTEFKYNGTMIQDYVPIEWKEDGLKWWYENSPGLYDDIYMDLTFVDIFDKYGLDAPIEKFATAFANAGYMLWHANQNARYNILNGIMPPESGHWKNNPHADDLDFQIEADYAGLMAPAMVNAATGYTDEIGHIMNYGDGWYGGVYVAAMYSMAFAHDDIETVVTEALKTIPAESKYYQCMNDVINWHKQYPDDWKQTWLECEKKWSSDLWCPEGVFVPFNIDATINSAYVLIGLLYGQGDFDKTMDISMRCGQDSDCNPATAAGILGTMLGYSKIPEKWMKSVREVEDMNFAYTDISLNKTYDMSLRQALEVIRLNGGTVTDNDVTIKYQQPEAVRLEQSFPNHYPTNRLSLHQDLNQPVTINFSGKGIVASYSLSSTNEDYVAEVEVTIDGQVAEVTKLPAAFKTRRHELFFKYDMKNTDHNVVLRWLNPDKAANLRITTAIVYGDAPAAK